MPSWKLHKKYALKYGVPQDLINPINEIIDFDKVHDGGRRPRDRQLYPGLPDICVRELDRFSTLLINLKEHFDPDLSSEILETAAVHILLDEIEELIKNEIKHHGYKVISSMNKNREELLYKAAGKLIEKEKKDMKYALNVDPEYEVFIEIVKLTCYNLVPFAKELIRDIIREISEKGQIWTYKYGEAEIRKLLKGIINYGIIEVNGKPLPLSSAVKSILSQLRKGNKVKLGLSTHTGRKTLEATTADELYNALIHDFS